MAVAVFKIRISHRAQADLLEFSPASQKKAAVLVGLLKQDPFAKPCEKLSGDLAGAYSRRLNLKDHLVYTVISAKSEIRILRFITRYAL